MKTLTAHKRRRMIEKILKPTPKPRWAMKGTDPRRFDQQYPEGATLAQVAKRIATLIDTGADPNQQVIITAGNVCHKIANASTGVVTCNFSIEKSDVLDNSWRMVQVMKWINANQKTLKKADIVDACVDMLRIAGQNT